MVCKNKQTYQQPSKPKETLEISYRYKENAVVPVVVDWWEETN